MTGTSRPDGNDDRPVTVTVSASYYQYYLYAEATDIPFERQDFVTDGILAPLGPGVVVHTGAHTGPVTVTIAFSEPDSDVAPDDVAAECDLELSSGVVVLASMDARVLRHDFGEPLPTRVRAVVTNRIDPLEPVETGEHHWLWVWPSPTPQPRWRSRTIDEIGRKLQQVTDHVR